MVFFVDEDLDGPAFTGILEKAGIHIEKRRQHFESGTPDTIWIPQITEWGWVALTRDKGTKLKPEERRVIAEAGARMLILITRKTSHPMMAENFVNTYDRVVRFFEQSERPLVATLTRPQKREDVFAKLPGNVNRRKIT